MARAISCPARIAATQGARSPASMWYIASTFFSVICENGVTPGPAARRRMASIRPWARMSTPVHISVSAASRPT